jgi:UDP-N-acetylmuramoyl-tripeptide--D-alanyl-D-alanine ligase
VAELLWTRDELQGATGGRFEGKAPPSGCDGVSIDSRTIADGDLFAAIKGERFDGHDFAATALKNGASFALVSRPTEEMKAAGSLLVVDDPLDGLRDLGRAARARSLARIVAVTGSVGKTSAKEMLKIALDASGLTHASAASFNNHWGVPLTLARMRRETAYGVFEIGMNHAGEITPLVKMVRPHVAIITAIAPSHIGNFASLDGIADAKAEIFLGVEPGGHAVINRDTPYFPRLKAAAEAASIKNIVGFGISRHAEVRLEKLVLHDTCSCITADLLGEQVIYKLGMPGEHMALNSLSVLAAVKLMGADVARAALALANAAPAKGRGTRLSLKAEGGTITLIDESYNANPTSVQAALKLLGQTRTGKGGRRIAVLGDMLELGEQGPAMHAGLAAALDDAHVDVLYACGPLMEHLWAVTPAARRGGHAPSSDQLRDLVVSSLRAGDAVMIKGSLGSRMGPFVEAIKAAFPDGAKDT